MLRRSFVFSSLLLASLAVQAVAQEAAFRVAMSDGEAMVIVTKDQESLESMVSGTPESGIQIACDLANMQSTNANDVVIQCLNVTFVTASGLTGRSQRAVCMVKENRVVFQNDAETPVEIRFQGKAEGKTIVVAGSVMSLDLTTNLIRAHGPEASAVESHNIVPTRSMPLPSAVVPSLTPAVHVPDGGATLLGAPRSRLTPARSVPGATQPSLPNGK